jgi:hypothetical protein
MALTPEHRAEFELLGPEIVRIRLMASDRVAVIPGFKTATTRSDAESWLTEKRTEGKSDRRQWWWASQVFVFASLAAAVVLLSLDVQDRLLAIYSISGAVGWLAGAIAYFCWSILSAYQRKTKQRAVLWLQLGVSVAALVGFIWWFHYTVTFDLALPAAALIGPVPPAPIVAPAPVTTVAPVAPPTPVPVAPEPVPSVEPVVPVPVTSVAPGLNPNFTCTRNGNATVCK